MKLHLPTQQAFSYPALSEITGLAMQHNKAHAPDR